MSAAEGSEEWKNGEPRVTRLLTPRCDISRGVRYDVVMAVYSHHTELEYLIA